MDREIMTRAIEIGEATGTPPELLLYADPDKMEDFADMLVKYAEQQAPKVNAAPRARRSNIVRGNDYKPSHAEQFAELVRDRAHWA